MPRRGENIYKRKDGRWEGRYVKGRKPDGYAAYGYIYAPSYLEVKRKLRTACAETPEKTIGLSTDGAADNPEIKFGALAAQWLSSIRSQIKEQSYVKYCNILDNHILPQLGEEPLPGITTEMLENFIETQIRNGKKPNGQALSPKTVKDIFSVVKLILKWARRQQYEIPCHAEAITIKSREKEIRILTEGEQRKLEQFLFAADSRIADGILLSLYTGIRLGELCALRWNNILLSEGIVQIRFTMQRIHDPDYPSGNSSGSRTKVITTSPKSACSNRDIPLPAFLLERIRRNAPASRDAYFLTGLPNQWIEPRSMSSQYKKALCQCGIAETNFHVLRHTFASRCIEKNFDIKALSEILGHSNVNITLNRYVHTSMEQKRKNMELLWNPSKNI